MRKLILLLILTTPLFILSCQAAEDKNNKDEKGQNAVKQEDKKTNSSEKATIQLTKSEFKKRVMNYETNENWNFAGDKPCLVDFYADWCAPCRITSPILEDLAKKYEGKIHIYKVDVDKEKELASVFGVRGIPTFLYCPVEGKPKMSSGIGRSKEETKQMFIDNIEKYLLK
jgi:thioredoxin